METATKQTSTFGCEDPSELQTQMMTTSDESLREVGGGEEVGPEHVNQATVWFLERPNHIWSWEVGANHQWNEMIQPQHPWDKPSRMDWTCRWTWIGHVLRMDSNAIPRPTITWCRTIEKTLRQHRQSWGTIEKIAKDRKNFFLGITN